MAFLAAGGHFDRELIDRIEQLFTSQAPMLDRRPAVLVHGDLGNMEIFVDRRNRVVDIVDFGDTVAGDPLYDFAHFVRGGPADDPRSAAILPGVRRSYAAHGGAEPANWDQLFWIYDIFNATRGAEWCVREDFPWLAGLREKIVQLLDRLDGTTMTPSHIRSYRVFPKEGPLCCRWFHASSPEVAMSADELDSALTLVGKARQLAAVDLDQAERVARQISLWYYQVQALLSIARVAASRAPDRVPRLLDEADRVARSVTDDPLRMKAVNNVEIARLDLMPGGRG